MRPEMSELLRFAAWGLTAIVIAAGGVLLTLYCYFWMLQTKCTHCGKRNIHFKTGQAMKAVRGTPKEALLRWKNRGGCADCYHKHKGEL